MSQYPGNCLCGCGWHPATCWRCGCPEFVEDDGGDGDTTYRYPDTEIDAYAGWYLGKKYSLTEREDEAS